MEPVTVGTIIAFITIVGAGAKLWMSLSNKSDDAAKKAQEVKDSLASYKLHVSETYISKEDLRSTLQPLMDNISTIKGSIDKLSDRVDRLLEDGARAPRTRSRAS